MSPSVYGALLLPDVSWAKVQNILYGILDEWLNWELIINNWKLGVDN